MSDSSTSRLNMVNSQILTNKVTDQAVSDALLAVPRERFVPKNMTGVAYVDEDLQIGQGRFLLEPMIFARMIQAAEISTADLVLDLGCASGYSSAVLARLAGTVVGLEEAEDLVREGNKILNDLDIENAAIIAGRLCDGLAKQGPYDLIFMNGAVPGPPETLFEQLSENGRLITVERSAQIGRAVLYRRIEGAIVRRELFDAQTYLLPGFEAESGFQF